MPEYVQNGLVSGNPMSEVVLQSFKKQHADIDATKLCGENFSRTPLQQRVVGIGCAQVDTTARRAVVKSESLPRQTNFS